MSNRIISLTESDIMRMVRKAVLMERVGRSETVPGVKSAEEAAYHWAKAVRNGMEKRNSEPTKDGVQTTAGELDGIEPYNGTDYTATDWKFTIYELFQKMALRQNGPIEKGIGQEIRDMNYTGDERSYLRHGDRNDPYYQELASRPNRYLKPDSYVNDDIYMAFFNPTSEDSTMSNSTLDSQAEDIATRAIGEGKTGADVLNMISNALVIFTRHYFRDYMNKKGGKTMHMAGNSSLSNPITNEKDVDNYTGGKIENPRVYTTDMEISNQDADSMSRMSSTEALERVRRYFAMVLSKEAKKISDYYGGKTTVRGEKVDISKGFLVNAVQYILDNFHSIFTRDFLKQFAGKSGRDRKTEDNMIRSAFWNLVASKILDDYNALIDELNKFDDYDSAEKAGALDNDILKIFPSNISQWKPSRKRPSTTRPQKKTFPEMFRQIEVLRQMLSPTEGEIDWSKFDKTPLMRDGKVVTNQNGDPVMVSRDDRPIAIGGYLKDLINKEDELAEAVNRVVRRHLRRLMESRARR